MEPFLGASESLRESKEAPARYAKYALGTIGSAGLLRAGSVLSSRLLPFLNDLIPENLATKGIEKVSPRLGKFMQTAIKSGHDYPQVRDFLKDKAIQSVNQYKQHQDDERKNIISKYDPELHEYITKKGTHPISAGMMAEKHPRFKKSINRITKELGKRWDAILAETYGEFGLPESQEQMQPQQQAQPQQAQQQPGLGQQALAAMVQQISQKLGGGQ